MNSEREKSNLLRNPLDIRNPLATIGLFEIIGIVHGLNLENIITAAIAGAALSQYSKDAGKVSLGKSLAESAIFGEASAFLFSSVNDHTLFPNPAWAIVFPIFTSGIALGTALWHRLR